MRPELKAFYVAYAAWLDAGAPEDKPFTRQFGLCSNLEMRHGLPDQASDRATTEMRKQFWLADLDLSYPFDASPEAYDRATETGHHLNERRIAWVREHAQ